MLENMEVWKDIEGYPNYQISNKGRVWSVKRQIYMKPLIDTDGYHRIRITAINGKRKTEKIHRLVALAFVDNPEGKPEVDHIDRNRQNNCAENLRWVTHSENLRHRKHYTFKHKCSA